MSDCGIRTDDPTHRPPPERELRTQTNRTRKMRPTTRPSLFSSHRNRVYQRARRFAVADERVN
jgi:hypothetical protein